MIPIRDTQPSRNRPVVTQILIVVNVLVFFMQLGQGPEMGRFIWEWGLVPARYTDPLISGRWGFFHQAFTLFSFMFLHGGWLHIIGNMWTLWIFGDNVEDRLGPLRYLAFYLGCGLASGLAHFMVYPSSPIPVVGASGAIAGVMGAYFILYPASRILTLIPILIFPLFIEIPAFVYMGLWFFLQVFNAMGGGGGVAWWAHIGGFVVGALLVRVLVQFPEGHFATRVRQVTQRRKTPGLQTIRPIAPQDTPHMYGTLVISPFEALAGCTKRVNIPWGFYSRLYKITVPPKTQDGQKLRLKGLGRRMADGGSGDLYLKVRVRQMDGDTHF
ncbi:rhomboid family intramembrane serine protease [Desulfobotulus sp.]|jgi:membrane associated rhomboid family serine protease|uniref:rhomboid family intramembrane serine protease n=1 Tax=Desulfobotulus sp. TaxID=1940337 RepID=UPI002A3724C9|nr:rhomboid family intramembrane serine protease [Desulfobotulus sp.]MDY0162233.1 rhomboid family intramembrane serine protease [Desulfobotulus sp.]